MIDMRKWTRLVLLLVTTSLAFAWLCTGGIVINTYWLDRDKYYDEDFKPLIHVQVERQPRVHGVPYLCQSISDATPLRG